MTYAEQGYYTVNMTTLAHQLPSVSHDYVTRPQHAQWVSFEEAQLAYMQTICAK